MYLNQNNTSISDPNFTDFQKEVILTICEIQKESLINLYGKGVETWEEFQELYELTELSREEVIDKLSDNFYKFTEVSENPNKLFHLDPIYLSIFGHILFHTNEKWVEINESETRALWRKLFLAQDFGPKFKELSN